MHKSQTHGGRRKEEDGSRKGIGCCYEKNGEKRLLLNMETIFQNYTLINIELIFVHG